jgi:hypothetical protein
MRPWSFVIGIILVLIGVSAILQVAFGIGWIFWPLVLIGAGLWLISRFSWSGSPARVPREQASIPREGAKEAAVTVHHGAVAAYQTHVQTQAGRDSLNRGGHAPGGQNNLNSLFARGAQRVHSGLPDGLVGAQQCAVKVEGQHADRGNRGESRGGLRLDRGWGRAVLHTSLFSKNRRKIKRGRAAHLCGTFGTCKVTR